MNIQDMFGLKRKKRSPKLLDPDILPNPGLEEAIQHTSPPLHPLVSALKKKSGYLNFVRNKRNKKQLALQELDTL